MSATIDNRIVQMNFKNQQFQAGIAESSAALDKFNLQLNALGGSGSSMSELGKSVDFVANRFSWFGDMAFQAMERINAKILDVAQSLYTSFMVEPRTQGFQEYEMTIDAIQTMMNSTGESLEVVNGALDKLNEYADKTIYSFADMKTNISKFTNAGLKMDAATTVLEGISNLVALAGGNAQSASMAFYNLGQAFSKGKMTAIDWKSLELAGVNTQEFTQYVLEAGVAAGTLQKNAKGMYKTLTTNARGKTSDWFGLKEFRDNLQYGFMDLKVMTDVFNDLADTETDIGKKAYEAATSVRTFTKMMETLKEAAGTQWATTFQLVIGDFHEAKKMWTEASEELSKVFQRSGDVRNAMLKEWKEAGGRTAAINGIATAYKILAEVLGAVNKGFRNVFPKITGKQLAFFTQRFAELMGSLKPAPKTLESLTKVFTGLFSAIHILITPLKIIWVAFKSLFGIFTSSGKDSKGIVASFLELAGRIGDYVTALNKAIQASRIYETTMFVMQKVVQKIKELFNEMAKFLETNPMVQGFIKGFVDGIKMVVDAVKKFVSKIIDTVRNLLGIHSPSTVFYDIGVNCVKGLVNGILAAASLIKGAVTTLIGYIRDGLEGASSKMSNVFRSMGLWISEAWTTSLNTVKTALVKFSDSLNNIRLAGIDYLHQKFGSLQKVMQKISDLFNAFVIKMTPAYKWVTTKLGALIDYIVLKFQQFDVSKFLKGGALLYIVTAFANMVKNLQLITQPLNDITSIFGDFMGSVGSTLEQFGKRVKASALKTIAIAVAILAGALILLSLIGWEKLLIGLGALSTLMAILVKGMNSLNSGLGSIVGGTTRMIALSVSMLLLAGAVKTLAQLPWQNVLAAGGALFALGLGVGVISKALLAGGAATPMQLIAFGIAIRLMAGGIAAIAAQPVEQIMFAFLALTTILATVAMVADSMKTANLIQLGMGFKQLGVGLLYMALAIGLVGKMNPETIGKGILAIAISMGIFGLAIAHFKPQNVLMFKTLAKAMMMFAIPIYILGKMDLTTLAKGIGAIAITLGVIALAFNKHFGGTLVPDLTKLGLGLIAIAIAFRMMGTLDPKQFEQGSRGIAGVLFSLVTTLKAFQVLKVNTVVPQLTAFAGALLLLSIPVMLLGQLDLWTLVKGLIGLAGMFAIIGAAMVGFSIVTAAIGNDVGGLAKIAGVIALMAMALSLFVLPISILGLLPIGVLIQGMIALAVAMYGLVQFFQMMPNSLIVKELAMGLLMFAGAIAVLGAEIAILGMLDPLVLAQGLGFLALTMISLIGAIKILAKLRNDLPALGAGLLLLAVAFGAVSAVLVGTGFLSDYVMKGLLGLGIALAAIALGALAVTKLGLDTMMIQTSVAIGAVAMALTALVIPLAILSALPMQGLLIGVLAIGGLLVVMSLLGNILPIAGPATLMFGLAMTALGLGAYLAVAALEKLVDVIARVVNAIKESWVGKLFGWNTEKEATKLGESTGKGMTKGLENATEDVNKASTNLATAATNPIEEKLRAGSLDRLVKNGVASIPKALSDPGLISNTTKASADLSNIPVKEIAKVVQSGDMGSFGSLLGKDLLSGLEGEVGLDGDMIGKMFDPTKSMEENKKQMDFFFQQYKETGLATANVAYGVDPETTTAVKQGVTEQRAQVTELKVEGQKQEAAAVQAEIKAQGEETLKVMAESPAPAAAAEVGKKVTGPEEGYGKGMADGMAATKESVQGKVDEVVEVIAQEASPEKTVGIGQRLAEGLGQGFIEKLGTVKEKIGTGCKDVINSAKTIFGIASPSRVFADMGRLLDVGLANGISQHIGVVIDETQIVGDKATTAIQTALSKLNLEDMDIDTNPTITPVLDLDNVKANAAEISDILAKTSGKLTASVGSINVRGTAQVATATAPAATATVQRAPVINNQFNVRNESDARTISNRLGTLLTRAQYSRGQVATA